MDDELTPIMSKQRISQLEVELYKREVLEQSMLVSPKEAAKILSCSETTIYRRVKDGDLKGYSKDRNSKGLRLLAAGLVEYVQSIKINPDDWRE